jgi:hypothetical protein
MYGTKKVNRGSKSSFSIKEGAMTAAAKREGVSNSQYEQEHKGDSGLAGKRARLAITMKGWHHG